ncbi:hypothetical protein KUCAC02_017538, partial [Chaenocephalus aceratus]
LPNTLQKYEHHLKDELQLPLHSCLLFWLRGADQRIKGLWDWGPEDVHCWADRATKRGESVVYQTCQAPKGEGGARPGTRFYGRVKNLSAEQIWRRGKRRPKKGIKGSRQQGFLREGRWTR